MILQHTHRTDHLSNQREAAQCKQGRQNSVGNEQGDQYLAPLGEKMCNVERCMDGPNWLALIEKISMSKTDQFGVVDRYNLWAIAVVIVCRQFGVSRSSGRVARRAEQAANRARTVVARLL